MTQELAAMSFSQIVAGIGVWIIILAIFAPSVFEGIAAILALAFFALAVVAVATFRLLTTIGTMASDIFGMIGPNIGRTLLLIGFIVLELFGRRAPEPEPEYGDEPWPEPEPRPFDKIAWALATLGLTRDGLTPETLKQAYRQAIRAAHPDLTGSADDAIRINRARDTIRAHFGWN